MTSMYEARRSSDALRLLLGQLSEAMAAFVSNYGPERLALGDPERLSNGQLTALNDAIDAMDEAADVLKFEDEELVGPDNPDHPLHFMRHKFRRV